MITAIVSDLSTLGYIFSFSGTISECTITSLYFINRFLAVTLADLNQLQVVVYGSNGLI